MDLILERPGMETRFCHLQILSLMYLRHLSNFKTHFSHLQNENTRNPLHWIISRIKISNYDNQMTEYLVQNKCSTNYCIYYTVY